MNLLVLNPNASASMTALAVAAVQREAAGRLEVRGRTSNQGPPVVATRESFIEGAWAALQAWHTEPPWAHAVLLACFGDPGLAALRETSPTPVIGMADSALREAAALGRPFHILTAGRPWDTMLRETVRLMQLEALLDDITVLDTTGLDISADPEGHARRVQQALDDIAARGRPTCVLGGTGFAALAASLRYDGVLIDGIAAATREALRLARSRGH